jgi:CheY-like chemotaxis protein
VVSCPYPESAIVHTLIIEDEALVSLMLEQHLRPLGFSSFDYAYGEDEAVDLARRRWPDLVVVDLRLGQGDGLSALRRIEEMGNVTAVVATGDPRRLPPDTPRPVVLKPILDREFTSAVKRAFAAGLP